MYNVKFLWNSKWFPLFFRQTPGGEGRWGDVQFSNDLNSKKYDACAVYNNLPDKSSQTIICPNKNRILLMGEPPSRTDLHPKYISQFSEFYTCHSHVRHSGLNLWQQGLPWWVGLRRKGYREFECRFGYDELSAMTRIEKTKEISIVCSNLMITPEHRKRVKFVKRLIEHFGDRLDVFGDGFQPIEDKWDAISPYKYHISLENSHVDNYWTEKLADAFLGGALPIYSGCPNIEQYFSQNSYVPMDYRRPAEEGIEIIEKALSDKKYEQSKDAIWDSRDRVLNEHNVFAMLAKKLQEMPYSQDEEITLQHSAAFPPTVAMRMNRFKHLANEAVARACIKGFN